MSDELTKLEKAIQLKRRELTALHDQRKAIWKKAKDQKEAERIAKIGGKFAEFDWLWLVEMGSDCQGWHAIFPLKGTSTNGLYNEALKEIKDNCEAEFGHHEYRLPDGRLNTEFFRVMRYRAQRIKARATFRIRQEDYDALNKP